MHHFIRTRLWNGESRTLLRRFRQGHAAVEGYAEDYAYLIFGLLELFQADGDPEWLAWARELQQRQDELFWDSTDGGWFSTTGKDLSVLLRLKEDYDGAEPAASSIGAMNLMVLAHLTGEPQLAAQIDLTLRLFAGRAAQNGRTVPMALAALSTYHAGAIQVVLSAADEASLVPLKTVLSRRYLPSAISIPVTEARLGALTRLLPWVGAMRPRDVAATAYVCRDFACMEPAVGPEALARQLDSL